SPRTLWELTQIRPQRRLLELIRKGKINSGTTREEAIGLHPKPKRLPKPQLPKLKREIATLVDVGIELGGADCVLAHIRSLKRARGDLSVEMFDQAVRWAKPQLEEREGDE